MTLTTTPALTLDEVAEKFSQWRSTKKSGDRIPSELWALAKSLVSRYKISRIGSRLRIATTQLRREGLVPPEYPKKRQFKEDNKFVNVQLDSVLSSKLTPESTLALTRADGTQLTLSQPSTEHLALFIKSFIE